MYKCRVCSKIAPQEDGLVIAMYGNVLLAVCPECVKQPIVISRLPDGLRIEMQKPEDNRIIPVSNLHIGGGVVTARPQAEEMELSVSAGKEQD